MQKASHRLRRVSNDRRPRRYPKVPRATPPRSAALAYKEALARSRPRRKGALTSDPLDAAYAEGEQGQNVARIASLPSRSCRETAR